MGFLSGFGIKVMLTTKNEFGSFPSISIFWNSFKRIGINSSLNVWQNSPGKPSGPRLLFVGRFLMTASMSLLVWVCSGFLFLPGSVWVVYTSLGMHPFPPDCQICWHIVAHNTFLYLSVFLWFGCDLSSFIHDFIYLGPFSFLFGKSGQGFISLTNSFKEPALSFSDLFYCPFGFYFIDFCSDLYYFSSPGGFRFSLLLFLQLLQVQGQVVYLRPFFFLEKVLYCYSLSSQDHLCCIPKILTHCVFIFISLILS